MPLVTLEIWQYGDLVDIVEGNEVAEVWDKALEAVILHGPDCVVTSRSLAPELKAQMATVLISRVRHAGRLH